jgi:two-component system chemotaxis response regulator CheB
MNIPQRCVVIGASAGGLEALKDLVSRLPVDFPAPVFVVMHIAAHSPSVLPEILSSKGPLPAVHPEDGARIEPGTIYLCGPSRPPSPGRCRLGGG